MNISTLLLTKIKSDKSFRLKLAIALNISERQVQNLVKANSENLTNLYQFPIDKILASE